MLFSEIYLHEVWKTLHVSVQVRCLYTIVKQIGGLQVMLTV